VRILLLIGILAAAQAQQPARVEFEVASLKPGDPMNPASGMSSRQGEMEMHNATLATLILNAYGLNQFQLSGGPKWMNSAKFNLIAKYPRDTPHSQVPLMMQALLADRFQLKTHREIRTLPLYDLVVAKGGPKLEKASETDTRGRGTSQGPRMLKASGTTLSGFALILISAVGAPVENKTGIEGIYNINLEFAPMQGATPDDDARPSLFTAIQQLGLRLEATKGPVDVLVVDSAELLTGN
jgi:uncharacterized protein (TIGR03435 family)